MLVGRDTEVATLERLLAEALEGTSGALVVRGEAGIGKTVLLEHAAAVARARGFLVVGALGVESEAELPYAALHGVVRPLLARLDELPPAQARALRAALGLGAPEDAQRFLVGVGVLTLLADAAEDSPVLAVLDDAQWFDRESAEALAFAARRLSAEGVVVLFGVRDEPGVAPPAGLRELVVGRLPDAAARALLHGRLGEAGRGRLEDVLRRAGGNPLALLELGGGDEGRSAGAVERAFLAQAEPLPEATREVLLIAAAEDAGSLSVVGAAARALGHDLAALEPAELAGLVRVEDRRVTFRHPLVRSALLGAAPFARRARAHVALADALAAEGDLDRRAWHLAAAHPGVDEAVADELARTAGRARERTGFGAASSALEAAAARTGDPARRTARLVEAAELAHQAGDSARALDLLERAGPPAEAGARATASAVRGGVALGRGETTSAVDLHLQAARLVGERDPAQALTWCELALEAASFGGHFGRVPEVLAVVRATPRASVPRDEAARAFVEGLAAFFAGDLERGLPALRRVVDLGTVEDDPRALDWAGTAALYLGRADLAQEIFARTVAVARGAGAAAPLAVFLHVLATTEAWLGRPADAEADATEALALARETRQDGIEAAAQGLLALLAALRGEEDACRDAAERALAVARPRGLALAVSSAGYALGLLDLGQGRAAEALDRFAAVVTRAESHPIYRLVTVPDLAEAAVRAGRPDIARAPLEAFAAWAAVSRAPWALASTERTRALLGPPEEAEARLREAMRLDPAPLYRARAELLLGEHLRRARRTSDARPHLRAAREAFAQLGAAPWAARAAAELRATGETVRRGEAGGLGELTPQELQITRLVAGGATNREVAAQLFVSPKTVEYHLGKVFTKLGVASRTELAGVALAAA